MTPSVAAYRLLCSVLLGGCLGIFYDFLRPLGSRHPHRRDLFFLAGVFWAWLYLSFAVCRGDIRTVYLPGMAAGGILWEATAGKWMIPFFSEFWKGMDRICRFALFPLKKILYFLKILFASAEKWVTIECNKFLNSQKKRRKETHGTEKHPAPKSEGGNSSCIQYP